MKVLNREYNSNDLFPKKEKQKTKTFPAQNNVVKVTGLFYLIEVIFILSKIY